MSIDVGESFRNGLQGTFSARGLVVGLFLLAVAAANLVVNQSIQLHVQRWVVNLFTEADGEPTVMPQIGSNLPFALDVAIPVLLGLTFAFLLVNEVVRLVAIRLFASESSAAIPTDDITENFGSAALKVLVLGGTLSLVVTLISIVPLIGPVIGWILVLLFVYLRQVIALEDRGWFDTVSRSVDLFTEDIGPIVGILFVLGVFGVIVSAGVPAALLFVVFQNGGATTTGSILQDPQALTALVGAVLGVIFQVLGIAVVTDAYEQVCASADKDPV